MSDALGWLHIEVKRVQSLNLAEASAQAQRDCGGKPWIVAHRQNRGPWFVTMDSAALYDLLHKALTYFDLWPCVGPRPVTMDAELFFLREVQRRRHTDEHGYVLPQADGRNGTEGTNSTPHPSPMTRSRPLARPSTGLRPWRTPFAASQAAQVPDRGG